MFFKISFDDFRKFLEQKFQNENTGRTNFPIHYVETNSVLYLFKIHGDQGIQLAHWCEIKIKSLESLDAFKTEFLANAVELEEMPFSTQRVEMKSTVM